MANVKLSNLSAIWTSSVGEFDGIKLNVTDTASSGSSNLMNLQVNGFTKVKVNKFGIISGSGFSGSHFGSLSGTSSVALNSISSSYGETSLSSSYSVSSSAAGYSISSSFSLNSNSSLSSTSASSAIFSTTSSYSMNGANAQFAVSASYASNSGGGTVLVSGSTYNIKIGRAHV